MSRTHASWSRLPGAGKAAIVCAALALLVLLLILPGLIGALVTPEPVPTRQAASAPGDAKDRFERYVAQVDGRSLFFVPAAPPPAPAPTRADDRPSAPSRPSRYAGPALVAMIGDTAWFADGKTLTVGSDAEGGMKLIAVSPPWSATVEWSGVEFEVPLFERDTVVQKATSTETAATGAGPED